MQLRLNTLILCLVICSGIRASHLVGGELYYEQINTTDYLITLKIYRDCNSVNQNGQLTPFDDPAIVAIYDGINLLQWENFSPTSTQQLPVIVDNPCLVAPPNICVDEAVYSKVITLPAVHNELTITYQRCCRNQSIINITGPPPFFSGSNGSTYTTTIPPSSTLGKAKNSSPVFKKFPPLVVCLNDNIRFNHSAIDPDGDSLSYNLCDPYIGLTPGLPTPFPGGNLPQPAPYTPVPWSPGYSALAPMNGSPQFAIDPVTGTLTGSPTIQGQFVVGVCVSEFRNGVFLSETKRDFQFNVTFCNAQPVAAASSQESFCDGLTVRFQNNSNNAKYFNWDFGVPGLTSDTSSLKEPSYTYPDTGKYEIKLVVNKGWPCEDSTSTIYAVYDELQPSFEPGGGQCYNGNSFDFKAGGLFQDYANFEWNFGESGNPSKSFVRNPTGIRFSSPGEYEVSLIVRENGCEGKFIDTIKTYPNPVADFELAETKGCLPFNAEFENFSQAWTDIEYLWSFGDGSTSTEANPEHLYELAGWYDVTLRVTTSEVCVDTNYYKWDRLVKAHELPTAGLIISNHQLSFLNPEVTFSNQSFNSNRCKLLTGDGNTTGFCDFTHVYADTGSYVIKQIAYTQYGCTDTLTDIIHVNPELLFYAPNSFTPNGDKVNDVYKPVVFGVKKYNFKVMNRWGEILYETNRTDLGWDGLVNQRKEAPVDGYVYLVTLTDYFGKEHQYRAIFNLFR